MENIKSKKFVIKKSEQILLFNALSEIGYDRNLKLSIPMLNGVILFKFSLEPSNVRVYKFLLESDYIRVFKHISDSMKNGRQELPQYQDIVQSFYQSGILKLSGLKQLDELLSGLKDQNITKGGDVYYIALDTNLLRERFFSVYLSQIPPCRNIDFILCETVRDEMKNRVEKTGRKLLNSMNPIPLALLQECFSNQNCLEDRLRYIGLFEYNYMRSTTSCEEIDSPSEKSGMKNDQYILEAYSNFVDIGRKVVFISKDNEAVRMMTGEENVIPIYLESNSSPKPEFNAKWSQFFDFIYILGILFGRVDILIGNIPTASLYGVWKGKDVIEWENEKMLLKIYKPLTPDEKDMADYKLIVERIEKNLLILNDLAVL